MLRNLQLAGTNDDINYVKLATALLIGYRFKQDFREHFSTFNYEYIRNNYQRVETRFVQNAQAVFLHQVLSGNNPKITLQNNHLWRMRSESELSKSPKQKNSPAAPTELFGGFIKKLNGLFGKKKEVDTPVPEEQKLAVAETAPNENGTPFLPLWNKVPEAYVQFLMDAELEEIHQLQKVI